MLLYITLVKIARRYLHLFNLCIFLYVNIMLILTLLFIYIIIFLIIDCMQGSEFYARLNVYHKQAGCRTNSAIVRCRQNICRYGIYRQGKAPKGLDCVKNHHTVEDVKKIRRVLDKSKLLVRLNPIHQNSESEIESVIAAGADIVMLPMWKNAADVKRFLQCVD